jgi:ribosomal protein S18 acetylase RimI-like enzyme
MIAGPMSFTTRPARPDDHAAFVRLFPELAVDDPIMGKERFVAELMPTTIVAVGPEGDDPAQIVGYAYFQIIRELAYVRHIVTAPQARKQGVGRVLMAEIASRARAAGCTGWCLNVKPENTAALALYGRVGLQRVHESHALRIEWSLVGPSSELDATVTARVIEPSDDARVEPAMKLHDGQLSASRAMEGRVLIGLFEGEIPVAMTLFDPRFPGAYPFRAVRPELAFVLLRAIRPYARPSDDFVNIVIEGHPDLANALLSAGATLRMESHHMKGPLPAA